jgi:hypothetical protein
VITALHFKRNRSYLHTLVFVLLASWIFLTLSATCLMPSVLITMSDHMPGCPETAASSHPHHQEHSPQALQDCSLKPCLDSQPESFTDLNRLAKPDLPIVIPGLLWTFWHLFVSYRLPPRVPPMTDPPLGRRILLIYRFCTLLN